MTRERFHELGQFFGGYFHQDWGLDASDWQSVIRRFVEDASPDEIRMVATQLGMLLSMSVDDERLHAALLELGCDWTPRDEMSDREWLYAIHNILRSAVATNRSG